MRGALRLLIPFLAILAMVACGPGPKTIGGVPRKKVFERIVSLSPSTSEIVISSVDQNRIKGRTEACNFPQYMVDKIPVVASLKPDYESLQTIGPDLIVLDGDLYNEQDTEKLKSLGAELFVMKATTVEELIRQIYEMAALMGNETQFSSYVERVIQERNRAIGDKPTEQIKVAVVLPGSGSEHLIAGTDSFQADVIRISGGTPVGPKSNRFEMANSELLIAENPDVLIVPADKKDPQKALKSLLADPRLRTLKAVQTGRVKFLDADIALRKGGRVDKLIQATYRAIRVKN